MKTAAFARSCFSAATLGIILVACGCAIASAQDAAAKVKIAPVVPMEVLPFDLTQVRLLDGPFKHAMELDRRYLLSLDVGRLLHNFRINAGLPSSAQPLGGWEAPDCELRGHFIGHYLSGCALMYASTGDQRLKAQGNQVVAGLAECQQKLGGGYLSAYPESFIDRVEKQQRVWAPWYTLHKILAGLLDMYVYCDNQQALDVAKKFGDWVKARTDRLTEDQMQQMLRNEHGGMNEALANLYSLTGDRQYLQLARRFNHLALIGPASQGEDRLTGLHANTQIPKFIGTAREYELTGEDSLKNASLLFWNTVVKNRSYVIGGHSNGEMFTPTNRLSQMGPNTTETCNTYNMLKLTRHLFTWDPAAEFADYYERALYNHILASQNPETGMMCYYVPLQSGSRKNYNTPLDSFWCCTGTGVENHAKYSDSIYFHDAGNALYVNLFIASELNWKAKGLRLRQENHYPDEAETRLLFTCARPVALNLHLRSPGWADKGIAVTVNGKPWDVDQKPGAYAVVSRTWRSGDVVEVKMPFTLRTEGFRDNPHRFALLYGPVVLCASVDAGKPYPVVVGDAGDLLASLKPVPGRPSTFAGSSEIFRIAGEDNSASVTLEPFYKMHGDRRYVVYWDAFTPAQWQVREAGYKADLVRQKALEARTVDAVNPGEEQNERDHRLQGDRTSSGDFGGRKWRHAWDGGWFSWELKVLPDQPQELSVTYWGGDAGNRVFDILIDGAKLATQRLRGDKPDQFYDQSYSIPDSMTHGKDKVTIRFQANPGQTAGGVFGVRVLRSN